MADLSVHKKEKRENEGKIKYYFRFYDYLLLIINHLTLHQFMEIARP